eukprot:jgi/Chrzof1/2555/Cz11g20060.t1
MGCCCCKSSQVADNTDNNTSNAYINGKKDGSFKVLTPWPGGSPAAGTGGANSNGAQVDSFETVKSNSAVKVAVMVRPLLGFEREKGATDIVTIHPPSKISLAQKIAVAGSPEKGYDFMFDRVYRADGVADSRALYEEMVINVLDRFCQGFNGTVLAYGQTGAGKTYTMGTAASVKDVAGKSGGPAVVPKAVHRLMEYVSHASKAYDIIVKVCFVEIYNELIQDLLVMSGKATDAHRGNVLPAPINIRETPAGEIILDGVTEVHVQSKEDIAHILEQGNACRATAAHKLNQESSRSHAILMISLDQRAKPAAAAQVPPELCFLRSKLHLVDLAGSERAKETGTTGQRFAEGVSINKGLLELGNVINALTEGTSRKHIPYRNSKLTRLLQDSLGGNSETLFIACVSPADSNHDHTISTLRYASRAMKITNSLQLNNQMSAQEELAYLRKLVAELQAENGTLRDKLAGAGLHVDMVQAGSHKAHS